MKEFNDIEKLSDFIIKINREYKERKISLRDSISKIDRHVSRNNISLRKYITANKIAMQKCPAIRENIPL